MIGVDPGLAAVGWGVIDEENRRLVYRAHGCIETGAGLPRAERLLIIYEQIRGLLETWRPNESAIETLFFSRNRSSALAVAEARGVISLALARSGLAVREFSPNAIKQAVVGHARADKTQVQEMTRLLLALPEIPRPDHASDALAAAICAANSPDI
ncbi:MAG: crossover junction endodeoxyribonuclease RuvC [Spirochaetaceae bacterium]|nr:crossover junction endodeoxyribonuclease RuvC [Spirochaetaceae bacterium]